MRLLSSVGSWCLPSNLLIAVGILSGSLLSFATVSCNDRDFESETNQPKQAHDRHPANLQEEENTTNEPSQENPNSPTQPNSGAETLKIPPAYNPQHFTTNTNHDLPEDAPAEELPAADFDGEEQKSIEVLVRNIRWDEGGDLCFAVYDNSESFLQAEKALYSACTHPKYYNKVSLPLPLHVENIAISVLHDRDRNGKVTRGFLGIPREGVGFSNNPKLRNRAPRYEETVVSLLSHESTIVIRMIYFSFF